MSPDGSTAAVGIGTLIQLIDIATGQGSGTLSGHSALVADLAFRPDGLLVSGSVDPTVRVWDPSALAQFQQFDLPVGNALAVRFVTGSNLIASAGDKQSALVFDCDVCIPGTALADLATERVTRPITETERARFGLPPG